MQLMKQKFGIFLMVLIHNDIVFGISDTTAPVLSHLKLHRIRHQRHLLRHPMKPLRFSVDNHICASMSLDENTHRSNKCPKRCNTNFDCRENLGRSMICICDPHLCGVVCVYPEERCPTPRQPFNGQAHYNRLLIGDEVEYTCNSGYAVKGPRKRFCQANLRLSGQEPNCTDQIDFCFTEPHIPNTKVADGIYRTDYKNGETVNITCKTGFKDKHRPYTIALCAGNVWKYDTLHCKKINCKKLENPINGSTMFTSNFTYMSQAIQFCNDGFELKCPPQNSEKPKRTGRYFRNDLMQSQFQMITDCKRVCQADGTWSGEVPICDPILCDELTAPLNGEMLGSSNRINYIKTFKCNKGYQLSGSHVRKCMGNGKWDGHAAICNVRNCGPSPQIPFARVDVNSTIYGGVAVYNCDPGTTLVGKSNFLTCGEFGNNSTWLPSPVPQCLRHCYPFQVRDAQVFLDTQIQSMDIVLRYEVQHGTRVKVKCNYGFELKQAENVTCNNGSWSYQLECIEASCSSRPQSMKYSTVRFYSLKHNALARYYCHSGYRIKMRPDDHIFLTSFDIRCIRGNWTKIPSEGCEPTRCNKPSTPLNGEIYLLGQSDRTPLTDELIKPDHNRVIQYECSPDYRLNGPKIAVCLSGQWSPPEVPTCEFIMHDELPLLWLYYQSHEKV